MRAATRFVLVWDISPTKEKYDAAPLLRAAKDMAGGALQKSTHDTPERLPISDLGGVAAQI